MGGMPEPARCHENVRLNKPQSAGAVSVQVVGTPRWALWPPRAAQEQSVSISPTATAIDSCAAAATATAAHEIDFAAVQAFVDGAKSLMERDPAAYLAAVDTAIRACQAHDQSWNEMRLVYYRACACDILGRFEEAFATMTHAHQLAVAVDDLKMQANAIGGLGGFLVSRGDAAGAIEHLEKSLPMHRAADNPRGVAATLNNLGFAYLAMRGLEGRAIELFSEARQFWLQQGVALESALALANVACAELSLADRLGLRDAAAAQAAAGRAYVAAKQAGHEVEGLAVPRVALDARIALAGAATLLGRHAEAMAQFEEAGRQLSASPSVVLQTDLLIGLGRLSCATAAPDQAVLQLEQAAQLARDNSLPVSQMRALKELSSAHELGGDLAAALRTFRAYHELAEQLRDDDAQRQARAVSSRLAVERAEHAAEVERLRSVWLEEQNTLLAAQALQDGLTGLPNRRAFDDRLNGFLARGRDPRVLVLADVDHFKAVNDRHSHLVGDEVLRHMGCLLRSGVPELDFAARIGGEEFALLFVGVDAGCALASCERLRELVAAQDWAAMSPGLRVTLSMGLAKVRPGEDGAAVLTRADQALYGAKAAGRNRALIAPGDDDSCGLTRDATDLGQRVRADS